jgi:hypothetical protein
MEVFISTSDIESKEVEYLKSLFTSYNVNIMNRRSMSPLVNLQSAVATCNPEKCCLFLDDTSQSLFTEEDISEAIEDILCHKWDMFYLCRWLDYCEEYTKCIKLNDKFLAVKSPNPQGIQALIIAPKVFEIVISAKSEVELLNLIKNNKLKALTSIPNMFEFNIGKRESDADIIKRFPCQSVFSSDPKIRSFIQNGGSPEVQLELVKAEIERTAPPKPISPYKQTTTATATKPGGWLDSFSYDDLTKAFLLMMIIGVIVSCFKK